MESGNNSNQKTEIFLEKYPYLEPLLQHYDPTNDRTITTMDDYIVFLNKSVLKYSKTSDSETVSKIFFLFSLKIQSE